MRKGNNVAVIARVTLVKDDEAQCVRRVIERVAQRAERV
jgi:hypothetical protein